MPDHGVDWDGKTIKDETINFVIEGLMIDERPPTSNSPKGQGPVMAMANIPPRLVSIDLKAGDTALVAAALLEYSWNQAYPLVPVERDRTTIWFAEGANAHKPISVNGQNLAAAYTTISGIKIRRIEGAFYGL